jgi:hypothetical protein
LGHTYIKFLDEGFNTFFVACEVRRRRHYEKGMRGGGIQLGGDNCWNLECLESATFFGGEEGRRRSRGRGSGESWSSTLSGPATDCACEFGYAVLMA